MVYSPLYVTLKPDSCTRPDRDEIMVSPVSDAKPPRNWTYRQPVGEIDEIVCLPGGRFTSRQEAFGVGPEPGVHVNFVEAEHLG
jgi:hypothetical protein